MHSLRLKHFNIITPNFKDDFTTDMMTALNYFLFHFVSAAERKKQTLKHGSSPSSQLTQTMHCMLGTKCPGGT